MEHDFYFPFHKWDVILPIDELIFFRGVETTNQFEIGRQAISWMLILCLCFLNGHSPDGTTPGTVGTMMMNPCGGSLFFNPWRKVYIPIPYPIIICILCLLPHVITITHVCLCQKMDRKKTPQSVNDLGKFDHDLTATEPWNHGLYMGNHPQMALFQISELL